MAATLVHRHGVLSRCDARGEVHRGAPAPRMRRSTAPYRRRPASRVIHEAGLVHRDIKPANLIITGTGVLKIVDFGLAAATGADAGDGMTRGTVAYMSPEQTHGRAHDPATDVWSLGVVLHEMLSGERPFGGDTAHDVINAIRHGAPAPLLEPQCRGAWRISWRSACVRILPHATRTPARCSRSCRPCRTCAASTGVGGGSTHAPASHRRPRCWSLPGGLPRPSRRATGTRRRTWWWRTVREPHR
jgi:serine/threonine protein kinase